MELLAGDTRHWVIYRRETDIGMFLDRRLNVYLASGQVVVLQAEDNDWHLRSAFFVAERNSALTNRQRTIRNAIRNQIGKPISGGLLQYDRGHRYRSPQSDGSYAIQTDFQLSDLTLFGVKPISNDQQMYYFDLTAIPDD